MKKIKLEKLAFKKVAIVELNKQQLIKIIGGDNNIEDDSAPRTITTHQSTRCLG